MRSLCFLVVLLFIGSAVSTNVTSEAVLALNTFQCECSWEGLWLDVILLIDNSNSMTESGLAQIKAHVATMLNFVNISDSDRNSHFGVISYSNSPNLTRDLGEPQNVDSLTNSVIDMEYSGTGNIDINAALKLAQQQLQKSKRKNARKVIIVYGTVLSAKDNPFHTADQLKEGGVSIVTVAILQNSEGSLATLIGELASPGMNLTSSQPELFDRLKEVLCDANCFCPVGWQQYHNKSSALSSLGQCFMYGNLDANWFAAQRACQREGGYLMAALTDGYLQQVKDFLQQVGQDLSAFYKLHVGLSFKSVNRTYIWEGNFGALAPQYQSNWCAGFPDLSRGQAVLSVLSRDTNTHCWVNENEFAVPSRYICQKRTCDAGQYCS